MFSTRVEPVTVVFTWEVAKGREDDFEEGITMPNDKNSGQREQAAELADRAAESVDRRYDATKELHLGDTERDRPEADEDEE